MILVAAEIFRAKILIVDDQEANVMLLEQILADAGYTQVSATTNPEEVCALHREHAYDLILLDLQMPGMDGFQVMAGLNTNTADGYLPVIVLTAQPGHKLRALQAGAKDFISKPFDLVEARLRIRNMLEVRLLYRKLEDYNVTLEKLVEGMTFTIEPMINAGGKDIKEGPEKDGWSIVTKDRSLSAQWEHTVLVTPTGYQVLTLSSASPPIPAFVPPQA